MKDARLKQLWPIVKETAREAREHPAILAAIFMRPMGFVWRDHRWVDRGA